MHSVDMTVANPGVGMLECRVNAHQKAGMRVLVEVRPTAAVGASNAAAALAATPRVVYMAAEEDSWDYAPKGFDACSNTDYKCARAGVPFQPGGLCLAACTRCPLLCCTLACLPAAPPAPAAARAPPLSWRSGRGWP